MNTRSRDRVIRLMEHTACGATISATTHGPQYALGLHTSSLTPGDDVISTVLKNSISRRRFGVPMGFDNQLTFQDWLDDQQHTQLSNKRIVGRPRSLPPAALERVLQLYESGIGYQRITGVLRASGIDTSPWSVRRAVKGLPPYDHA